MTAQQERGHYQWRWQPVGFRWKSGLETESYRAGSVAGLEVKTTGVTNDRAVRRATPKGSAGGAAVRAALTGECHLLGHRCKRRKTVNSNRDVLIGFGVNDS